MVRSTLMMDFSLQTQLEEQGKDELRAFIRERIVGDYAHYCDLPETNGDSQDYELAMHTLKSVFRVLQRAGIKFDE